MYFKRFYACHFSKENWTEPTVLYLMNDFFLSKKVKILIFVSMSVITPYINYDQYEGGLQYESVRHIISTSEECSASK